MDRIFEPKRRTNAKRIKKEKRKKRVNKPLD